MKKESIKVNDIIDILSVLLILGSIYVTLTYDNVYLRGSIVILFLSLLLYIYGVKKKNFYIKLIGYYINLIVILFGRKIVDERVSTYYYLNDWIKLVLSSKIVFINIIGNLLLYIPIVFLSKSIIQSKTKNIFVSLVLIITLETLQYFLKLGVFDIIDILLNFIGVILSLLINEVIEWTRRKKIKSQVKKED